MYHAQQYDVRTFLLYLDRYENGVPVGRFHCPSLGECGTFQSMTQLMLKIDQCLDIHDMPQAFHAQRCFSLPQALWDSPECGISACPGKLATFSLQILFRRNASWQGTVTWLEKDQCQRFRSVLELMGLINSAAGTTCSQQPPYSSLRSG